MVFELKKEDMITPSDQGYMAALKRHFGVAKYDKFPRKYYQNAMAIYRRMVCPHDKTYGIKLIYFLIEKFYSKGRYEND